jgi:hypothetical protein
MHWKDAVGPRSTDLDEALDRSLALLERGETLEGCVSRFPEHAGDLRPLLEVAVEVRRVPAPTPTTAGVTEGKRRMLEALAQREEAPASLPARLRAWISTLFRNDAAPVQPEQDVEGADSALYQALDDSLTSLEQEGITVEDCLTRYAEYADELRPLLQVASRVQSVPRPQPSQAASVAGKRRMLEAVKQRQRPARVVVFSQALLEYWPVIRGQARSSADALSRLFSRQWTAIRERMRSTAEALSQGLSATWTVIRDRARSSTRALSRLFSRQWTASHERMRSTAEALSQALSATWTVIRDRARSSGETLSQRLSQQWTAIRERTRGLTLSDLRPVLQRAVPYALLLSLLVVIVLFVRGRADDVIDQTAALARIDGMVEVLPAGEETWQSVAEGAVIEQGDRIRTGPSAIAMLKLFDGSVTALQNETELSVARMEAQRDGSAKVVVLYQWIGETHHRVEPLRDPMSRFQIETATAVAAVQGTEFTIGVKGDGATEVKVLEGFVRVTAQNVTVGVKENEETSVTFREPPSTPGPIHVPRPTRLPTAVPGDQGESSARQPTTPSPTTADQKDEPMSSPELGQPRPPRSTSAPDASDPSEVPATVVRSTEEPATPTLTPRSAHDRPTPTSVPSTPRPRPTLPPTDVPRPTPLPTGTPSPVPTRTPTPTPTDTPSPAPTRTPTPTPTDTPSPMPTRTPTPTPADMPSPTPTPEPTPVSPLGSDATPTPASTAVPTSTPLPSP